MPEKLYPYQCLTLDDLEGEQWVDLRSLDGFYRISNFGRVKRLQYELHSSNGGIVVKLEKIIKPTVVKVHNRVKKDYTYYLSVKVTLNGARYSIPITRMVYYCFVEPFDLEGKEVIVCMDNNNFNVHPGNLEKVTRREKQKRVVERNRSWHPFFNMTESGREKHRNAVVAANSRQVTQYTLDGRKIRTFPSATAAKRATGVSSGSIGKVATAEDFTAGGYVWRWGNAPEVDVVTRKQERRKIYVKKHGMKVTQYSLSGERIAVFSCVRDAKEASGAFVTAIHKVLKGEYKSANGFFWKKGHGKAFIDLSGYAWDRQEVARKISKPVKQFALDGKYIQSFPSVKQAAQHMGLSPSTLVRAMKGKKQISGGFKWKYG